MKLSSLGDVIHTLPAVSDAAAALPGIRFDWVVEEAFAEIPRWHAAVDTVLPVALRRWRKGPLREFRGPAVHRARHALRRQCYDAVIDAQGLIKSAVIARLVSAPRYGMDWHSVRERLATSAYQHRIRVPRELHAVLRIRLLFARALQYPLPDTLPDYGVGGSLPQDAGGDPKADLMFFHGTARPEKLWPEEYWAELAQLAAAQGHTVRLPWGNAAEEARAQRIAAWVNKGGSEAVHANAGLRAPVRVLPRLSLSQLARLLRQVRGAVAVDTGLGHLAAALDVPTVSLYGPTRSDLVGTCGRHQVHMQAPLWASASAGARMAALNPAQVWARLQALLQCDAQRPAQRRVHRVSGVE